MKFKFQNYFQIFFLLVLCLFVPLTTNANTNENVWHTLAKQFTLNHSINRPEVNKQINWIKKHPTYIKQLTAQSEPYIYFVTTEVHKRNLPGEIALMPMIESGYNPFAYSGVGAAGIWQMMPVTGADFGLRQDWWADHRRNISASTKAALNYLQYLNKFFGGNWNLAIAAYDSGEGKVARTMRKNHHQEFWRLPLPRETKAYIPRLMALAEIIENPKRYNIELPDIPNKPYFTEVNIDSQIDLIKAAALANISYHELIKLNPGYNRWATAPNESFSLLLPVEKADRFYRNLLKLPIDKRLSLRSHTVQKGETLKSIASQYHTSTSLLQAINQLKSNNLVANTVISIPTVNQTHTAHTYQKVDEPYIYPHKFQILHIVDGHESMRHIQRKYSVNADDIRKWNNMDIDEKLKPGQHLLIWRNDKATKNKIYRIRAGDTLSKISVQQKVPLSSLRNLNPNIHDSHIKSGQKIKLA